ncbi:MAG: methylated-DNA--[protein]-cysteine S-methyltransferase [Burkholderiaceae bacterium]|nr:methylated-DNA--[protein]-cysteine S-methyltransferase [Burkholderiaceae bacterium]
MKPLETYAAVVRMPFGAVGIRVAGDTLAGLDFLPPDWPEKPPENAPAANAARQLRQYLAQPDFRFDLPLAQAGTAFQRAVWREIATIPPGKSATYGQLARRLDFAPRAVGQACGANPFPLITPCHRVIAANGGLGGFAGRGADAPFLQQVKRWLLQHEGVHLE